MGTAISAARTVEPRLLTPGRVRAARDFLAVVGAAVLVFIALRGPGTDATSYWSFNLADPYAAATRSLTGIDAFRYGPPLAYVFVPFHALPFDAFRVLWAAIEFGCLIALVQWRWALALVAIFPVVALEISSGNIHLLMALAVAIGFQFPAAWSFLVLTKITPGIGLLWFAVRRQWRDLGIAVGATLAIAVASYVATPGLWQQWAGMLRADLSLGITGHVFAYVPIPLWVRLPPAILLVVWGARRDQRWTLAVAVTLALPTIWLQSLSLLLGAVPSLVRSDGWASRATSRFSWVASGG